MINKTTHVVIISSQYVSLGIKFVCGYFNTIISFVVILHFVSFIYLFVILDMVICLK